MHDDFPIWNNGHSRCLDGNKNHRYAHTHTPTHTDKTFTYITVIDPFVTIGTIHFQYDNAERVVLSAVKTCDDVNEINLTPGKGFKCKKKKREENRTATPRATRRERRWILRRIRAGEIVGKSCRTLIV